MTTTFRKPQVAPLTPEEMAAVNDAAEKAQEAQPPRISKVTNDDVIRKRMAYEASLPAPPPPTPMSATAGHDLHHLLLIVYAGLITLMDRARVSREEFHAAYAVALESAGKLSPPAAPAEPAPAEPAQSAVKEKE